MIFLQIVIIGLLILLLVRSINHDNRMGKLEIVVGKLVNLIKVNETMNGILPQKEEEKEN